MASPIILAKKASFDDFMKEYDPATAGRYRPGAQTLLFSSVANPDVDARVAITNRLLDDGCDPSVVSVGINVLHVLFGRKGHDSSRESPMLRRLIEGGADINLVSKRWGPPLVLVMENGPWPEAEMVPFYEEFFRRPDLDLSVSSSHTDKSLREFIFASSPFPLLHDFVRAYDGEHGSGD